MGENGPAATARRAQRAVEERRREAWLACFAADCRIEDPVGHVPVMTGRDALAGFWDGGIAGLESVRFTTAPCWETEHEVMLIGTVEIVAAGGASVAYDGAFHYAIDPGGSIASVRAFWDLPAVVAALTTAS